MIRVFSFHLKEAHLITFGDFSLFYETRLSGLAFF